MCTSQPVWIQENRKQVQSLTQFMFFLKPLKTYAVQSSIKEQFKEIMKSTKLT